MTSVWLRDRRFVVAIGGAAGILFITALLLAAAGGSESSPGVTVVPRGEEASTPDSPQALREATIVPVVEELDQFRETYGDPPDAQLGRFRIPKIGVDAPLGSRVVPADGRMPLPSGPSDVVWYDFSGWPGYGGAIGAGQNAMFAGHVDYAARVPHAGVNYSGRGIFYSLELLAPGDSIEVETGGRTTRYRVAWKRSVPAGSDYWGEIMSSNVGADSITLITCTGEFDIESLEYSDRLVIRAVRS